jgi:hypothetical protein
VVKKFRRNSGVCEVLVKCLSCQRNCTHPS